MAKPKSKTSLAREVASFQNAATTLLANIRFSNMDNPIKTVVITSAVPGEGKSTVSCNLAQAMALGAKRTLVVDCDSFNRTVTSTFDVKPSAGLIAVLSKQVPLEQAIAPTAHAGLFVLDIEPNLPNPADIFASKRFSAFIEEVSEQFDYVVFDTPPVCAFVDAAVIASHVDACVLVVGEGHSRRKEVAFAAEQLRKADANIVGVCMNNVTSGSSGYGYGYDYGYGYGYGNASRNDGEHGLHSEEASGGTRFKH